MAARKHSNNTICAAHIRIGKKNARTYRIPTPMSVKKKRVLMYKFFIIEVAGCR